MIDVSLGKILWLFFLQVLMQPTTTVYHFKFKYTHVIDSSTERTLSDAFPMTKVRTCEFVLHFANSERVENRYDISTLLVLGI